MTHILDEKDFQILFQLDHNSRQSIQEISKKTGMKKSTIAYRLSNLTKHSIIKRFHTAIDMGKLGYISFRLYLKLQNTTPEKEKEIILFLKEKKEVTWLVSINGNYNIGALILTKSITEMNNIWKELLNRYIDYFDEKFLTIMTRITYYPRTYLSKKSTSEEEIELITEKEDPELDKTDIEILKLLAPNSRINVTEIANKIGITTKTTLTRIRSLTERKVIVSFKTLFDLEKLGYKYLKVHFKLKNLTKEKNEQIYGYAKAHPNIIYHDEVLGGDDFEIELQVKNDNELAEIIDDIRTRFSEIISQYHIMTFKEEHKYLFIPVDI